jgi:hypothetical protein
MLEPIGLAIALSIMLLVGALAGFGVAWLLRRRRGGPSSRTVLHADLQEIRAIGELSVFRVVMKEILTHSDHSFGDFGKRYLSWAFTQKKLAMIFEFEVDFRFDLRSPEFEIRNEMMMPQGVRHASLKLPPCRTDVMLKDVSFYDEQKARLLPWLLPDLLSGFFPSGFTEADKNRLIAAAREHARAQAAVLAQRYRAEIEGSARQTLGSVVRSLGIADVQVSFVAQREPRILDGPLPASLTAPASSIPVKPEGDGQRALYSSPGGTP